MYLGIEIGGTKLQLGVGADDGTLAAVWRGTVDPNRGAEGIREQILAALPALPMRGVRGVGVGFGGPVDDPTRAVIRSHQIRGWDGFPLADWVGDVVGLPAVLGNDADVAGLAEARHGAGKGLSPLFYMTVGSGIGGGLILDGKIYRGAGRGAAEVGQLISGYLGDGFLRLEEVASGWAIDRRASHQRRAAMTSADVAKAARAGDDDARRLLEEVCINLAHALNDVITLLCPRRVVIGGGVSLLGEDLLFTPLRRLVEADLFEPFRGLTDIVPAALGEAVVVHGAIALARQADTEGRS
ncbi:MAG: ROK family protein [Gemmataceae bacterium]